MLVAFGDKQNGSAEYLMIEAKVGAVVNTETLVEYREQVQAGYGPGEGLLVSAYEPAGSLPPGWTYKDLGAVADQLSCPSHRRSGSCMVCEEISFALAISAVSTTVSEWRALAEAARKVKLPDNWQTKGGGSSVGRPLVYFQSPYLDAASPGCWIQVEVGNNYNKPTASVMIVSESNDGEKAPYPDRLWKVLASCASLMPPLPGGVTDVSTGGTGAKGQAGVDAARYAVPPGWSRGFSQPGRHGRGRTLRHVTGDYAALLPAAIDQGLALFATSQQALT